MITAKDIGFQAGDVVITSPLQTISKMVSIKRDQKTIQVGSFSLDEKICLCSPQCKE